MEITLEEEYKNMREVLEKHPHLVEIPASILRDMGVEADKSPIRGGTDGATLSFRGLPCPNLGTGGHNFHGRREFVCVQAMDQTAELLLRLVQAIAREPKNL